MIALGKQDRRLFIVEKGEKLIETLTRQFKSADLSGGVLSGLGALTHAELGYYHLNRKEYTRKRFDEEYELLSLTGNIALKDGLPFIHAHVTLSGEDFSAFGGHLFEAVVAVTAEISVIPFDFSPERKPNDSVGLATICGMR